MLCKTCHFSCLLWEHRGPSFNRRHFYFATWYLPDSTGSLTVSHQDKSSSKGSVVYLIVILQQRVNKNGSCCPFMLSSGDSQLEEWSGSVVWWYGRGYFVYYLLTDDSRMNWLWLESFSILLALCRYLTSPISLMLSRWVPMMLITPFLVQWNQQYKISR